MIIGIVAISKNYAIGKAGKLPWHFPADLRFFKETTTGHIVVMGATTWLSIGKPLPGRLNVVLSRSGRVETPSDIPVLGSKAEVVKLSEDEDRDIYIIGGAEVFAGFADVIDKWLVTLVPLTIEDADTFMPKDFLDGFEVSDETELSDQLVVKTFERSEI